ncbi:MAG: hypothetical protein OXJ64_08595, partial [Boseongicola sp.]|nr:hypothetical protein [Boseongicola sp.]
MSRRLFIQFDGAVDGIERLVEAFKIVEDVGSEPEVSGPLSVQFQGTVDSVEGLVESFKVLKDAGSEPE